MSQPSIGQTWRTTTEGLCDGMSVLATVDCNQAHPSDVLVMNVEEESEGVFRFWDHGSCFYFENPHETNNFVVIAWQPLPEPYNPDIDQDKQEDQHTKQTEYELLGYGDIVDLSDTELAAERSYDGDI